MSLQTRVRTLLKEGGWLQSDIDGLSDDGDLYAAGLTSHATVNLMRSEEHTV